MIAHAFTAKRYFDEVTIPALQRGLATSGRTRADVQMFCPVFVVTGTGERKWPRPYRGTRKPDRVLRLNPAYRKVLELHGWGELQTDLHRLADGRWDAMADLIDDGSSRPSPWSPPSTDWPPR